MSQSKKQLKNLNNAVQHLLSEKLYFSHFPTLEDWIAEEIEKDHETKLNYELKFFSTIYDHLITDFRNNQIFVSPSFLEYAIFDSIATSNTSTFLENIKNKITENGFDGDSVVIFPLHSFGYSYRDIKLLGSGSSNFMHRDDFRVHAQSNSLSKTITNIFNFLNDINLRNKHLLSSESIEHLYRSRNMLWLERNPIMLTKFKFSQGLKHDNLSIIREHIKFSSIKLFFFKILSEPSNLTDSNTIRLSTSIINNLQTLDIKHFLTVSTTSFSAEFLSIPVRDKRFIFDDSNMNLDILFDNESGSNEIDIDIEKIFSDIDKIKVGIIRYRLGKLKKDSKYSRFGNALSYFRQAVRAYSVEEKVVNLNTAFEICLLDKYERNKSSKIFDRTWQLLHHDSIFPKSHLEHHFQLMVNERNAVLHAGEKIRQAIDFVLLYHTFARLFLRLMDDIEKINSANPDYMRNYFRSL